MSNGYNQEELVDQQMYEKTKQRKAVFQSWNKNSIKITYIGVEVSATAEVTANSLKLAAPALTVLYTIDITAVAYDTLTELVAYINGLADWECTLGDQFDGTEASASLTIIAATDVKTAGVWFVQDTNLQIKIVLPTVAFNKRIKVTKIIFVSTYDSGASALKIYKGSTQVWEEAAASTTVEKESSLPSMDGNVSEQVTIKVVNSAAMTAGHLVVTYEEKVFPPRRF